MKRTASKVDRTLVVCNSIRNLKCKGYPCGKVSMMSLAEAYGISLCREIVLQSEVFTRGDWCNDRCAMFQSAAVLVGLKFGRVYPSEKNLCRPRMEILSSTFTKYSDGYMCSDFPRCRELEDDESMKKLVMIVVEALDKIFGYE